ncbi:MAG: cation:proton antiporter [Labilithrix sp.]|nr:cation:proton antiporter [Labilithrix sp.]MCW5830988.1 cation:proton antiporter [Labilithrix sp.]
MTELNVLMTFTGGLAAALVLGFLAKRLRLSPIVGYLIAGIAVGPFTPGYVADHHVAEQFAEIGVILLLFGIGLRFHLRELLAVWRVALPGALFQSAISTMALAALLRLIGYDWQSGIVLGIAISVASTVVMALVLAERRDLHAPIGHIAIGWTVVEDLLTVTALLLLPMFLGEGASGADGVGAALGEAALKIGALVALVVVLGKWVIPWSLEHVAAARSRELFTLSVLVIALGIAVGSAKLFGVSMALGAFLAGLAVGRSEFAARAANDALPMQDAFAVLFFVSVGMLCDPRSLVSSPLLIALVLVVVLLGKPLAAMLVVRVLGKPMPTAVAVGAALSQVGEFSFILGSTAKGLGVIDDNGWNALIGASILSIALNPTIYRLARRAFGGAAALAPPTGERPPVDPRRCVLVGHGPVGSTVRRILAEHDTDVTVVELNLDTVRSLRAQGQRALYGDVLRPGTLEEAGIATAGSLILSVEIEDAAELIRQARAANPSLRVLARCAHLREAAALRDAGATVVAGEAEVAIALAEVLRPDEGDDDAGATRDRRIEATRRRLYERHASG